MSRPSCAVAASLATLTLLTAASPLWAGEVAVEQDERGERVDVDVHASPEVTTEIRFDGEPVRRCIGDCRLSLPRGDPYVVFVDGPGMPSRKKRLSLDEPTRIDVEGGSSVGRGLGLAGGIALPVVAFVALMANALGSYRTDCGTSYGSSGCGPHDNTGAYVVAGLAAAGTVGSWVLYAVSGTSVDAWSTSRASAPSAARAPRVAFGVAPTKGGAFGTLGLTV
jgi:hypothetical protein